MSQPDFRYALGIEYCGHGFHGWQFQPNGLPTIQQAAEEALGQIVNNKVRLKAAGRTDKGVHATGQVVHFDALVERSQRELVRGGNSFLPSGARFRWAKQVSADFDARFSAQSRTYRYLICNDPIEPALMRHQLAWWARPLEAQAMHQAAQFWLGERDFSAFRASGCSANSPWRRVDSISVVRVNQYVMVEITASAFLLHMVRNMAGTLRMIGEGRQPVDWANEVLVSKDRGQAGVTAEPGGLYLSEVKYADKFGLPQPAQSVVPLALGL